MADLPDTYRYVKDFILDDSTVVDGAGKPTLKTIRIITKAFPESRILGFRKYYGQAWMMYVTDPSFTDSGFFLISRITRPVISLFKRAYPNGEPPA